MQFAAHYVPLEDFEYAVRSMSVTVVNAGDPLDVVQHLQGDPEEEVAVLASLLDTFRLVLVRTLQHTPSLTAILQIRTAHQSWFHNGWRVIEKHFQKGQQTLVKVKGHNEVG